MDTSQLRDELLQRIDAARTRRKRFRVLTGLSIYFGLMALVLAADLLIYQRLALPPEQRLLILRVTQGLAAACFLASVVLPWAWPRSSRRRIAQLVERYFGDLQNGLITILECGAGRDDSRTSEALLARAVGWTANACSARDFRKAVPKRALTISVAASVICVGVLSFTVARHRAAVASAWQAFASEYTTLHVRPGDAYVQYGEGLRVQIEMAGRLTTENWLAFRLPGYDADKKSGWQEVKLIEQPVGSRHFAHVFQAVRQPVKYYVRADQTQTREYTVRLKNPRILSVEHTIRYPEAFGLEPERREGGEIETFPGVKVRLHARASEPLSAGRIVMNGGSTFAMEADGMSLFGEFAVTQPGSYHLETTDLEGDGNLAPEEYEIRTIIEPVVRVLAPGNGELEPRALLPLKVWTGDDRGVICVDLRYRLRSEGRERLENLDHFPSPRPVRLLNMTWHLRNLGLKVGEVITYRVEAKDENGNVTCSDWNSVEVTEHFAGERYKQDPRGPRFDVVHDQQREKWPRKYRELISGYFGRLARFSLGEESGK